MSVPENIRTCADQIVEVLKREKLKVSVLEMGDENGPEHFLYIEAGNGLKRFIFPDWVCSLDITPDKNGRFLALTSVKFDDLIGATVRNAFSNPDGEINL